MSDHDTHGFALGSYLLGALGPEERRAVDEHLAFCAPCRDELARLAPVPGALAKISLQDLEREGTLEPPASLLPSLLSAAARAEARRRRRSLAWRMAAGGAVAASAAAIVFLASAGSPGVRGPSYDLRPSLAVAGLTGKVTLEKKPWGTELLVTASGLPEGTSCVAVVRGRDGAAQVAGSWGPTPTGAARVELATRLPPAALAGLTIETPTGHPLLSATLSA